MVEKLKEQWKMLIEDLVFCKNIFEFLEWRKLLAIGLISTVVGFEWQASVRAIKELEKPQSQQQVPQAIPRPENAGPWTYTFSYDAAK